MNEEENDRDGDHQNTRDERLHRTEAYRANLIHSLVFEHLTELAIADTS